VIQDSFFALVSREILAFYRRSFSNIAQPQIKISDVVSSKELQGFTIVLFKMFEMWSLVNTVTKKEHAKVEFPNLRFLMSPLK
jgi:hypothetical protein